MEEEEEVWREMEVFHSIEIGKGGRRGGEGLGMG